MSSMPLMPRVGDWTVADLALLPDDGLQYELADGVLLVTPAPRPGHQRALRELALLMQRACPPDLEVFFAPFDFQPHPRSSFQPDLLVVRRADVGEEGLVGTPLLVVEVLSPSTRAKDLVLKRALYAEAGVPSYWVVDPSVPSMMALDLTEDGEYVVVAEAAGDEVAAVVRPYPVSVTPSALV